MDAIFANTTVQPPNGQAFEVHVDPNFKAKTTKEEIRDSNGIASTNHEGGGCISFHNVSYTVEQRTCFKKRPPKVILNDVRCVSKALYVRPMAVSWLAMIL